MLGVSLKKQYAVEFSGLLFNQYSLGGAVLSNSCIRVTKNDEFICSGNSGDNIFKVFIEFVFCFIRVGHGGCIGADDGTELFRVYHQVHVCSRK